MRRYRGSSLKIDWQDEELLEQVEGIVDLETSLMADVACELAKFYAPKDTGTAFVFRLPGCRSLPHTD